MEIKHENFEFWANKTFCLVEDNKQSPIGDNSLHFKSIDNITINWDNINCDDHICHDNNFPYKGKADRNDQQATFKKSLRRDLALFGEKKFINTRFTKDRYFYGEIEFNWNTCPDTYKGKIKRIVFRLKLSPSGENVVKGSIIKNSFSGSIVERTDLGDQGRNYYYAMVDEKSEDNY